MKATNVLAALPLLASLAACGQHAATKSAVAASDLQVTNKVVMSCQASAQPLSIQVKQFKDARGTYGSDSLYVLKISDYSTSPAVVTELGFSEARVLAPADLYWLLLEGKNNSGASFDVKAKQTTDGKLLAPLKGELTLDGRSPISIYCAMGDVHVPGPLLPTR